MPVKTIDSQILNYLPLLGDDEKKSILNVIKLFLTLKGTDPQRVSIEQYNKELDEALARINAGNYLTQEEVEKQSAKW